MVVKIAVSSFTQVWKNHNEGLGVNWIDMSPEVRAWADDNHISLEVFYDEDDFAGIIAVLDNQKDAILFKLRWC